MEINKDCSRERNMNRSRKGSSSRSSSSSRRGVIVIADILKVLMKIVPRKGE